MEQDKSPKVINIFLDSNLFLHAKLFTEINWEDIFDVEYSETVIRIPFMVIKELDNLKYKNKRARQVIAKLRKLETHSEGKLKIELSIFPPKWTNLREEIKEVLSEEESDHRIISEILLFKDRHGDENVIFITGDYIPYKLANKLGINTINWLDDQYESIFKKEEAEEIKKPELELLFDEKTELKKVIERTTTRDPPKLLSIQDYDRTKNKHPLANTKGDNTLQEEINWYNEELLKLNNYSEIELIITNNSTIPYTNIDIYLTVQLEKEFILNFKENIRYPEKPKLDIDFTSIGRHVVPSPQYLKELDITYDDVEVEELDRHNLWKFGYGIKKIKHNEILSLYPIMIWIPENPLTDIIRFDINFTQDEPGKIRHQNICIKLLKNGS